jgi:thiamine-monophosphate kinase
MSARKRNRETRSLAAIGEQQLIGLIRDWLGDVCPPAPRGLGDDCAVVPAGRRQVVTVDPVVRGRHFTEDDAPALVAAKLLRRNLSDVAAMGGTPRHAVIALAAPGHLALAWLRAFYRALAREARRFAVRIVGGDCTQTDETLGLWLTLWGDAPPRPLTRSGGRAGDLVFVTGQLGGSRLGRHLRFQPRLAEGRWLARRQDVRAGIDVSDGLAKDIQALLTARTSVRLDPRQIPVSAAARRLSSRTGRPALEHACNDGEDHELLFVVAPRCCEAFIRAWHRRFDTRLSCIGRLEPRSPGAPGIRFAPAPEIALRLQGYEHFR